MEKKVLFVVDEKQTGGVSTVLNDLLNLINLTKYKVDVLVLHNRGDRLNNLPNSIKLIYGTSYFEAIDYTIAEVIKSKNIKLFFKKIRIIFGMKTGIVLDKIKKERKKMNLDQYDVEIAFKDGFTAIFTAAGNAHKKIHWLHYEYGECNPNAKYDKLFQQIFPKFNCIVGVSRKVVDTFNVLYHMNKCSLVISNVVDENRIKQTAFDGFDMEIARGKFKLVSVGRLHSVKGYDRLIKVLGELKSEKFLDNVIFDIYGDGPEKDNLLALIEEMQLNNIVTLKGEIENPYSIIKQYDLSLITSKYEAFGLSIVESMLVQVPVLATNTAAVNQLINDKVNGWICENSFLGIKQNLKELILNPTKVKNCKLALKDYHYNNEILLKQIESILDEVSYGKS